MTKNEGWDCHNFSPKMIDGSYACIAPVGGHTCLTAGERSEPAVVDYKRMNVLVPVGGPTTTKCPSPNRQMREKQHDELNNLW